MRNLLLTIAFLVSTFAGEHTFGQFNIGAETYPSIDTVNATIGVQYHGFLLFKYGGDVIALHIMPDPRFGIAGINYRWYRLTDGSDRFYLPSHRIDHQKLEAGQNVRSPSPPPNQSLKVGSGDTDEGDSGMGEIAAGPLSIGWSMSSHDSGWLYLSNSKETVLVYPTQFKRLQDASGSLDSEKWRPVNVAKRPVDSDDPL